MKLSSNNFLYAIKDLVMGSAVLDGGYLHEVPVLLSEVDLETVINYDGSEAGAAVATLSGAYLAADETNGRVIKVDAATDTVGHISFTVPSDYDEALDIFKIRILASMLTVSVDTDVELDSALYIKEAGVALTADQNPAAPGTVLSTTEQWLEFDLSGFGLTRDAVAHFKLITNGANDTAGEEVLLHGIKLSYRSTLVSYDATDSADVSLR